MDFNLSNDIMDFQDPLDTVKLTNKFYEIPIAGIKLIVETYKTIKFSTISYYAKCIKFLCGSNASIIKTKLNPGGFEDSNKIRNASTVVYSTHTATTNRNLTAVVNVCENNILLQPQISEEQAIVTSVANLYKSKVFFLYTRKL